MVPMIPYEVTTNVTENTENVPVSPFSLSNLYIFHIFVVPVSQLLNFVICGRSFVCHESIGKWLLELIFIIFIIGAVSRITCIAQIIFISTICRLFERLWYYFWDFSDWSGSSIHLVNRWSQRFFQEYNSGCTKYSNDYTELRSATEYWLTKL